MITARCPPPLLGCPPIREVCADDPPREEIEGLLCLNGYNSLESPKKVNRRPSEAFPTYFPLTFCFWPCQKVRDRGRSHLSSLARRSEQYGKSTKVFWEGYLIVHPLFQPIIKIEYRKENLIIFYSKSWILITKILDKEIQNIFHLTGRIRLPSAIRSAWGANMRALKQTNYHLWQ